MYQHFQFMLIKKQFCHYYKYLIPYGCVENYRCRPLYELCIVYIIYYNKLRIQYDELSISLMVCDWMMHLNWSIEG